MKPIAEATVYKHLVEARAIMEDLIKLETGNAEELDLLKARAQSFLADHIKRRGGSLDKAREKSVEAKRRIFEEEHSQVRARILEMLKDGTKGWRALGDRLIAEGMKPPRSQKWNYEILTRIAPEIKR
jgi:hypothetical protein